MSIHEVVLPTVYYLTLRYVVFFRFPPFYLSYLYFFRQYIPFHLYFIQSSSQFISASLVKCIIFCCCYCCCSYILFFCLFYSFVPIQLGESVSSLKSIELCPLRQFYSEFTSTLHGTSCSSIVSFILVLRRYKHHKLQRKAEHRDC